MSQTLEHIKEEIKTLGPVERFDLWRDLGEEFESLMPDSEPGSVEAAWNTEIDSRVKEIEEGQLDLVSADAVIERVRARLAQRRADPQASE